MIAPLSSVLVPTCPLITFGARVRSGKEGRRQEVGVFWTMVASSDWTYCSSLLYNISMIYVSLWQFIFSMKQLVSIYKQDKETQNIERLWKFCCGRWQMMSQAAAARLQTRKCNVCCIWILLFVYPLSKQPTIRKNSGFLSLDLRTIN